MVVGREGAAGATATVQPRLFRRAAGRFATGVCVVSAHADGIDHAITVNSFTSVSLDPPTVLVCIAHQARFHDVVLEAGRWAVSVLGESGRAAADWLATPARPLHGQFATIPHRRGTTSGAVLLDGALAWLECRTVAVHEAGDHSIVVAEVDGLDLPDEPGPPLLYHRGGYRRLAVPERA